MLAELGAEIPSKGTWGASSPEMTPTPAVLAKLRACE
jgi:hypothetical protein